MQRLQQRWWWPIFDDYSYSSVDINKAGCKTRKVCWWHPWLTSALHVCDVEHCMLA